MDESTQTQNPENTGQATPEAQTGDNPNPNLDDSKSPSEDNSAIKQIRNQLKEVTKELSQYKKKEEELTQAESLKKGEFDKILTEKEKALEETRLELESLKKEKLLTETLNKSNANPKYLDLIKANLNNVSYDELH